MSDDNFKLMVMEQRISRMRESLEALAKDPALSPEGNAAAARRILREDTELSLRRTGRTTRALLAALERAKAGERVLYVVHASGMVEECMHLIAKHAERGAATIQRSCITLGRGSLEVSTKAGDLHGTRVAVVYDHAYEASR